MKAQVIYDLAHTTAWISGSDMHDLLFRLTGEMCPSGKKPLNLDALADELYKDKTLKGLMMGLATFGGNQEVKQFITQKLKWNLGYYTPEYA